MWKMLTKITFTTIPYSSFCSKFKWWFSLWFLPVLNPMTTFCKESTNLTTCSKFQSFKFIETLLFAKWSLKECRLRRLGELLLNLMTSEMHPWLPRTFQGWVLLEENRKCIRFWVLWVQMIIGLTRFKIQVQTEIKI